MGRSKKGRELPIREEWVDWLQERLRILKDGSFLPMPTRGIVYQINKTDKRVSVVLALKMPSFNAIAKDSQHTITVAILKRLGYTILPIAKEAFVGSNDEFYSRLEEMTAKGASFVDVDSFVVAQRMRERFRAEMN